MRVVAAVSLSLVVATLAAAPRARACGMGMVGATGSTVTQEAQLSFVSVHADSTDVAVLLQLPSADADFGGLIPLPASGEPVIDSDPVSATAFAQLEEQSRPEFFSSDAGDDDGGFLFGCGSRALDGGVGNEFGGGVVAGDPVDVGPVTAQWLLADDGSALNGWLADNGFAVSADDEAVLDAYIAEGNGFLAVKRNGSGASAERTAVGVHFRVPGDVRAIALRATGLRAPAVLPLTTFVAFPSEVGPDAPFAGIHVADLDDDEAIADYAGAVDRAIADHGGKAFVFEGSVGKFAVEGTAFAALVDDGAVISRLSARLDAAGRDSDVIFSGPAPVPNAAAQASSMALPKHVDVAAVFLVGVTLLVRRRRR